MLQGEDGSRHEDRDLLPVGRGLERGADGDLGLAEPDVAAHEPVHGLVGLHIFLDGGDGGLLVGRILPPE